MEEFILYSNAVATFATGMLIASLFVPMAYCHYGCPTGALLNFVRLHGRLDHFGRRDVAALCLVALASVLSWQYQTIHGWIVAILGAVLVLWAYGTLYPRKWWQ